MSLRLATRMKICRGDATYWRESLGAHASSVPEASRYRGTQDACAPRRPLVMDQTRIFKGAAFGRNQRPHRRGAETLSVFAWAPWKGARSLAGGERSEPPD